MFYVLEIVSTNYIPVITFFKIASRSGKIPG
jgi:hypothetical protein